MYKKRVKFFSFLFSLPILRLLFYFLFYFLSLHSGQLHSTLDVITRLHVAMIIYKTNTIESLLITLLRYTYQRMHEHRPSSVEEHQHRTVPPWFILFSFFFFLFFFLRTPNIFHSSVLFHSCPTVSLSRSATPFFSRQLSLTSPHYHRYK